MALADRAVHCRSSSASPADSERVRTYARRHESGTVEEIDQFVAAGKPAMLYFSNKPIDPNKIDLKQQRKLRQFKNKTYKNALVGGFTTVSELKNTLLRDLTNQLRQIKTGRRAGQPDRIEQTARLTELMLVHKQHDITPEQINKYREILGIKRQANKSFTISRIDRSRGRPCGQAAGSSGSMTVHSASVRSVE